MGLVQRFFSDDFIVLEVVLRMLLSLILGFAIGFERKMRFKEAGIRTHTIVCLGACIYMLVSMFAFDETSDASRVAAQIVPGIGFIGAGMIFYRKKMIQGLTTAAGIWATAAVGMASGAGWYVISVIATILIIGIQCLMHLNVNFFHSKHFVQVRIVYIDNDGTESKKIRDIFGVDKFNELSVKKDNEMVAFSATISTDKIISAEEIHDLIKNNQNIISVSRQNDDF